MVGKSRKYCFTRDYNTTIQQIYDSSSPADTFITPWLFRIQNAPDLRLTHARKCSYSSQYVLSNRAAETLEKIIYVYDIGIAISSNLENFPQPCQKINISEVRKYLETYQDNL